MRNNMEKVQLLFVVVIGAAAVAGGAILEDGAYIESLSANIERSGLANNFSELWAEHVRTWDSFREEEENNDGGGTVTFTCNITSANESATSVHNLRPSDIGIIGAIGGSFVAGNGAGASHLPEVALEYRGYSFPIGGDGNLSTTITLPNILKQYNPNIIGWSRSIAPAWFEDLAQLNVAVPGAKAKDLEEQAKELINRINRIPDASDQWKVVSIFIGIDDLCEACDTTFGGRASRFGRQIKQALDTLEQGLTRTVVNLIALPMLSQWFKQLHNDKACIILHRFICPCIFNRRADNISKEYNDELHKLAKQQQYDREDFTVVVQHMLSMNTQFPTVSINGTETVDHSYFAPDCFHFSRKLHASVAEGLWTNMFQSIESKDHNLNFTKTEISCPDEECPYIRTARNSVNCSGHEVTATAIWNEDDYTDEATNTVTYHPYDYDNYTTTDNFFTMIPWDTVNAAMRFAQALVGSPGADANTTARSTAMAPWIAFIVILCLAVIAISLIGVVQLKQSQRRYNRYSEATPLLHEVRGEERIY